MAMILANLKKARGLAATGGLRAPGRSRQGPRAVLGGQARFQLSGRVRLRGGAREDQAREPGLRPADPGAGPAAAADAQEGDAGDIGAAAPTDVSGRDGGALDPKAKKIRNLLKKVCR